MQKKKKNSFRGSGVLGLKDFTCYGLDPVMGFFSTTLGLTSGSILSDE
jgi:hypothetical protein